MTIFQVVLMALLAIPTFFLWAALHELSHVLAARFFCGIKEWKINLLPHKYNGDWRFASATWTYVNQPTDRQLGLILLSPRIPDLVGALLFPWWGLFPNQVWPFWIVLAGGGLIDLWVGSWGSGDNSDLVRASKLLPISPWIPRVAGWAVIAASVATSVVIVWGCR